MGAGCDEGTMRVKPGQGPARCIELRPAEEAEKDIPEGRPARKEFLTGWTRDEAIQYCRKKYGPTAGLPSSSLWTAASRKKDTTSSRVTVSWPGADLTTSAGFFAKAGLPEWVISDESCG